MVSLDAAGLLAMDMPEVIEGVRYGTRAWSVGGKVFAWERPFSKADIKRFGADPVPEGPIFAVVVEDLGEKEAILATAPKGFFSINHFDGYPALLIQLKVATKAAVRDAIVDAWLVCAPIVLADAYLASVKPRSRR